MQDTAVHGITVRFYTDIVTSETPCGFMSALPIDPVPIYFNNDDVLTQWDFPEMYRSTPGPEFTFAKLPAFMKYNESTELTGNGVTITRAIHIDKCGPISAGEFKVWFYVKCGARPADAYEILFSIEGKDAEQCPQFINKTGDIIEATELPTNTCLTSPGGNNTNGNSTASASNSTTSIKTPSGGKAGGCWNVTLQSGYPL